MFGNPVVVWRDRSDSLVVLTKTARLMVNIRCKDPLALKAVSPADDPLVEAVVSRMNVRRLSNENEVAQVTRRSPYNPTPNPNNRKRLSAVLANGVATTKLGSAMNTDASFERKLALPKWQKGFHSAYINTFTLSLSIFHYQC